MSQARSGLSFSASAAAGAAILVHGYTGLYFSARPDWAFLFYTARLGLFISASAAAGAALLLMLRTAIPASIFQHGQIGLFALHGQIGPLSYRCIAASSGYGSVCHIRYDKRFRYAITT